MSQLCADPEMEAKAERGSDRGAVFPWEEAAAVSVRFPGLGGLMILAVDLSQPPERAALGMGSGNRSRTCLQRCDGGLEDERFSWRRAIHMLLGKLGQSG